MWAARGGGGGFEIGTVCLLIYLHLGFWKWNSDLPNCLLLSIQSGELCRNAPPLNTRRTKTLCSELPCTFVFKDGNVCGTKDFQTPLQAPHFCVAENPPRNSLHLETGFGISSNWQQGNVLAAWLVLTILSRFHSVFLHPAGCGRCDSPGERKLFCAYIQGVAGWLRNCSFRLGHVCSSLGMRLASCSQGKPVRWEFKCSINSSFYTSGQTRFLQET